MLPLLIFAFAGFAVLMYVLMDGWDLGVGILVHQPVLAVQLQNS
jgi:cytochrome bd-type quinol oxidase subunit 2